MMFFKKHGSSPQRVNYESVGKSDVDDIFRTQHLQPLWSTGEECSRARLLYLISKTTLPVRLNDIGNDFHNRLAMISCNAIAVELRDLFRVLEGLQQRAKSNTLAPEHISTFYDWFEGLYSIITCFFDSEEDVLFPWLEKVGAIRIENALNPKRRQTKKGRTKDICWDILELKMQFEEHADQKVNLVEMVFEMRDEAEHLAIRLLIYLQTLLDELPSLLQANFGTDEQRIIEETLISNFRASGEGRFVLCAYARGFVDPDKRRSFLSESFRGAKGGSSAAAKEFKMFQRKHTELADRLALRELLLGEAE